MAAPLRGGDEGALSARRASLHRGNIRGVNMEIGAGIFLTDYSMAPISTAGRSSFRRSEPDLQQALEIDVAIDVII
jgi:hypothetical protein